MTQTTVFQAKSILTMDPNTPRATHVAVRDGFILAVGSLGDMEGWGPFDLDTQFEDHVLMPGFVEGHSHMMAGGIWDYTYAGYHERVDPDGGYWAALTDIDAVIDRLKEAEAKLPEGKPLVAWGFDPIFLPTERLNKTHLDAVSSTRPIVVMHSNFHLMTVNSATLQTAGYSRSTNVDGVHRGDDGEPNGELQEMHAMFPVMRRLDISFRNISENPASVRSYGRACNRVGVTTATDLHSDVGYDDFDTLKKITAEDRYPIRLVPAIAAAMADPDELLERVLTFRKQSTDKLKMGLVKLMTDGSIQGFTARIRWPGYYRGPDHGIWNMAPEQVYQVVDKLNAAGVQMHTHTNGDQATEVTINAIEAALAKTPFPDHRHTLQHCQMASEGQFRRMAALGICANLFSNHIYYFGDQHHDITIGPDRARRMNATRSALENGVNFTIHSDAPVTPMGPLMTAWCAVNRLTGSGRTLGEYQKISVEDALHAITIGAAYTLKLDDEIGSIETGKRADFAVLEEDPTAVEPVALKDVGVWGTVLGGIVHPVP